MGKTGLAGGYGSMAGTVCSDGGGKIYYRTPGYGGRDGRVIGAGQVREDGEV